MELVNQDENTVTIRMNRKTEFATLLAVLNAASVDFEKLDAELLDRRSEDEVDSVINAFFGMSNPDRG